MYKEKINMTLKGKRHLIGLLSFLSLIIGMLIYFLFRDLNNMILFAWIPKPEFAGTVLLPLGSSVLSNILKFNLPDTLWFLSAILFLRFIWFNKTKIQKAYIHFYYAIAAIFEISQVSKKVPGTFDWMDLLFMGIGAFVEGLLYNNFAKRRLV